MSLLKKRFQYYAKFLLAATIGREADMHGTKMKTTTSAKILFKKASVTSAMVLAGERTSSSISL